MRKVTTDRIAVAGLIIARFRNCYSDVRYRYRSMTYDRTRSFCTHPRKFTAAFICVMGARVCATTVTDWRNKV